MMYKFSLEKYKNEVLTEMSLSNDGDFVDLLKTIKENNYSVFPGFVDVHVHLREPGFFYKETIKSGTCAAASGGYTTVMSMPNLNPVPDSFENLKVQLDIIKKDAVIEVLPFGSITVGQKGECLSALEDMAPYVAGFSDDGRGVQNPEMMKNAMKTAKRLNKIIVAHCEDNSLLNGGYIHAGEYAKLNSHKGIVSESEWGPIKRDIDLLKEVGADYHVCHVSTKESVEIIRKAKKEGVKITAETGPHYLLMNDMMLKDEGRFKMNPPIRSEEDRLALIEGIKDGTIDMIATDHAPHSAEEKSKGLKDSLMGIVGIETAFPLLYRYLVKENIITLERLIELMSIAPRKRFSLPVGAGDFTVWDINKKWQIDSAKFLSKGKSTPFDGVEVEAKCLVTVKNGKIVYNGIE